MKLKDFNYRNKFQKLSASPFVNHRSQSQESKGRKIVKHLICALTFFHRPSHSFLLPWILISTFDGCLKVFNGSTSRTASSSSSSSSAAFSFLFTLKPPHVFNLKLFTFSRSSFLIVILSLFCFVFIGTEAQFDDVYLSTPFEYRRREFSITAVWRIPFLSFVLFRPWIN